MKKKKSFVVPLLLIGLFFISAYLYLIVVGKNIPVWVNILIAAMIIYGIYSTMKKIKDKTQTSS
jgi:hypothetical protein